MELKKEPSKTLIYVSNLPFDTTDEQFRDLFKGFTVRTAYVARRKNGRSKGFGFANLDKETEQNAAIEKLNGFELSSRKLIAKVAMNDDRRNEKGELKEEFKSQLPPRSTPSETVAHVSNLEWTVNDEELRKIFAEFNPKVATVATRRNGRSKGYGFVEFNTKDELEKAVKLNGTTVSGRQITVQVSVKRTSTPNNNRDNNNRRPNRNSTRRTGGNNNNNRDNNRGGNNRNNNNRDNNSNRGGNNNNFNVVRRTERRSENTLYISNLPFELDDNDLKQIFQEFQPKNAQIPLRRNGKSRGYGFVEFSNAKDQNAALTALDQSEVNGRVVTIKVSSPNANRDNNNNRDNNRVTVNRRNNNNRGNNNRDNNRGNNRGGNNNNNNNNNRGNNNRDNNRNNNNNNRGGNNNNNNNNNNRRQPRENRPPRENREVSTNLVYVSNLPFNLEDNGLGEIFKGLKVNKAYVARRRNGYSKGFGFVEFASTEDQQNALKQNGSEVSGRPIVVQAAFKVDEKTN